MVLLSRGPRQTSRRCQKGPTKLVMLTWPPAPLAPSVHCSMRWIKNLMSQNTSIVSKQKGSLSPRNGRSNWHFASLGTFISGFLAGFHEHFLIWGYRVGSRWCVAAIRAEGCTSDVNWILWSLACPCNTNNWNIWQSRSKCIKVLVPTAIKKGGSGGWEGGEKEKKPITCNWIQ